MRARGNSGWQNRLFEKLTFHAKYIPFGGELSGFFGGLSGHQGELRTAFLIRSGLKKEAFIGTGIVSAVAVDMSRLSIYGVTLFSKNFIVLQDQIRVRLIIAAILAALLDSFIGSRLIKKITMHTIKVIVGILLLLVAVVLGVGAVWFTGYSKRLKLILLSPPLANGNSGGSCNLFLSFAILLLFQTKS